MRGRSASKEPVYSLARRIIVNAQLKWTYIGYAYGVVIDIKKQKCIAFIFANRKYPLVRCENGM